MVYQLFHMNEATHCVNSDGGSVCKCSEHFNHGIVRALQGVVSDATQQDIFEKLQEKYC